MEVRTLSGVAGALAPDLERLTRCAVEQIDDSTLLGDAELDASVALLLDRLLLSMQLAKPIGLATWAEREGRRLGAPHVSQVAAAAAQAIAIEANRFEIDHGRLLTFLEVLKSEIDRAIVELEGAAVPAPQPAFADGTQALLAMLAERDSATCCHSKATGEWARRLATAMHLDEESVSFIELCAVLHDIGKISTPDSILFKRGPLNAGEWDVMRDHSAAGQRILDQLPGLRRCAFIVRAHHERWDGAGYPDGLSGPTIPFEARIVAVADAFHAMISDRPYRDAMSPRQALEILRAGSGTQWEPRVVEAMLGLFHTSRRPEETTMPKASSTA